MTKKKTIVLLIGILFLAFGLVAQPTTQISKEVANDGAKGDGYGYSVDMSGEYSIVGAFKDDDNGYNSGSAYILFSINGNFQQKVKLIPSDGVANSWFGWSVSISGDHAVVGALKGNGGVDGAGAAYVFYKDEGGEDNWGQVAKLVAADGEANDEFGSSVSISGDYVVVGAKSDVVNSIISGSAYVFYKDEGGVDNWGQQTKLLDSNPCEDCLYGESVSIYEDYILIGVRPDNEEGPISGSAFIYKKDKGGVDNWGEIKKIKPSTSFDYGNFGSAVCMYKDFALIGANGENNAEGAAYLFKKDKGGVDNWGEEAKLTGSKGGWYEFFGNSVSMSDEYIVIGVPKDYPGNGNGQSGSAYIYQKDNGGANNWGELERITSNDGSSSDYFGGSVSISGDYIIVGAYLDDDKGEDSGSAYIFGKPVPIITKEAVNLTDVCYGEEAVFSIEGENITDYQWRVLYEGESEYVDLEDNDVFSGVNTATLLIVADKSLDKASFSCKVSNENAFRFSFGKILNIEHEKPVVSSTHNDVMVDANENCQVALLDYTSDVVVTDNCSGDLTITQSPEAGTMVSATSNQVNIKVEDLSGNIAEVVFNVKVVDVTKPIITSTHNDQTVEANADCEAVLSDYISSVIASDNCDDDLMISQQPVAGTMVSGTSNTISLVVKDDAGNESKVEFNVAVQDITIPSLSCIDSKTIDLAQGQSGYSVLGTEFDPVSIDDNCGVASVMNDFNNTSTLNGVELPTGNTTIVWTVLDAAGNNNTCSFDIEVKAFVGVDDLSKYGISVYPNPTKGVVVINSKDKNIQKISITDLSGKTLLSKILDCQKYLFDMTDYKNGAYVITIQTGQDVFVKKIVKE